MSEEFNEKRFHELNKIDPITARSPPAAAHISKSLTDKNGWGGGNRSGITPKEERTMNLDISPAFSICCGWCNEKDYVHEHEWPQELSPEQAKECFKERGWTKAESTHEVGTACPSCKEELKEVTQ